jgi:O-antigen/teichoic acid export membrane protein
MDLVGQTAVALYTAEASHVIRTNRSLLYEIFRKAFLSLLPIAVLPVVLMLWSGPWLFEMVFGHEWEASGLYAQIMAIAYGVRMAVSPLSQTLQMLGEQRLILLIEVARLLSILSVFASGHLMKLGIEVVLSWYSGVVVTFQMWMLFATWKAVKA